MKRSEAAILGVFFGSLVALVLVVGQYGVTDVMVRIEQLIGG